MDVVGLRADGTVDPEEGVVGVALLVALIGMFVAALVVPGVFDDEGVLFGAAFVVVWSMHTALYALAGREAATCSAPCSGWRRGRCSAQL